MAEIALGDVFFKLIFAVQPSDDLTRGGVIDVTISAQDTLRGFSQMIEPNILEMDDIVSKFQCEIIAADGRRRVEKRMAIFIALAQSVALAEAEGRNAREYWLQCGIDAMGGQVSPNCGRPARYGAHMQKRRHASPVIDGIVIPEKWFAPKLIGNSREMARRIFARTDFSAGPEDLDCRIEETTEILQIVRGAPAEEPVENWIVAVITRA